MPAKLKLGDVLADDTLYQVGPIPIGLLTLDGGNALRQAFGGETYLYKPFTADTVASFRADMKNNGLQVCDTADGAPYDFGLVGHPLSLWVKKVQKPPPDGPHPDITTTYTVHVSLYWGRTCILPPGNTDFNASYTYSVPITLKYGKIGDIGVGSATVPFGASGGTTASSWGPSGIGVTGNPGTTYTPQSYNGGTPRWFLNNDSGSPYYGYYQVDPAPASKSGSFTWSGAPYPEPTGLFCADYYVMVIS